MSRLSMRGALLVIALVAACHAQAQTNFALLASDGAWTWFNDPRALFNNGLLYFGYNRAADGKVVLSTLNLQSGSVSNLWISGLTQTDDHDLPGLLTKQDGKMLAVYSRHQSDQYFAYRLSSTANPLSAANWGAELTISNTGASMTYANPFQLSSEGGRVYNFCRNLNYNPTVFTSADGGATWSSPQILIQTGTGSTRPYVKYCSDYNQRLDFLYTDAHPDNYTNSLYHLYYQGSNFYETDGTLLKSYANLPILHDSGERGTVVYQYSDQASSDPNQWIATARAWCWEIAYQSNGYPVCVFQTKVDNVTGSTWADARIYYYYARWTGTNWQKRFIAQAGRPLYNGQPDYGGGMALDPLEPDTIYISTDAVNPFDLSTTTNVPLGVNYQLWKGVTPDGGLTFSWQPITGDSTVDNLRPYVPRRFGGEACVLWFRGTYTSYTSFSTALVGLFTTQVPQTNGPAGAWIADADGLWSDASKWGQGVIANGAATTADFSQLNEMSADRTVTLDSSRTIGAIKFGDITGNNNWRVNATGGSTLTLGGTPAIAVLQNQATLAVPLAGTNGFTKSGPGTLVLAAGNGLSGTLNVDSGSTTADDGALRVTSSAALADIASPIVFRNNSGANAVATFQMDGSAGNITVAQNFSTTCRNNNTIPTFESLGGTNTLAGTNLVQVGGTNVIYQSDAGSLLQVAAPIQYVGSLTAARTYQYTGAGDISVSGPILKSINAAPIGLLKVGSGTLSLGGANTYTNGTTVTGGTLRVNGSLGPGQVAVSGGTLAGTGVIAGPVLVGTNGRIGAGVAGATVGTLTINNTLAIQGGATLRINKTGGIPSSDRITGLSAVTYGGTLVVSNITSDATTLTAGDIFTLFNATTHNGSFASILDANASGTTYSFTNGILTVVSVRPSTPAVLTNSLSGNTLSLSWHAGQGWILQSATQLEPAAWVDAPGSDSLAGTNFSISPDTPAQFFRLRHP